MSDADSPYIINPPNLLGMKAGAPKGRPNRKLDPKLLAAAESSLNNFKEAFPEVLLGEVRRMSEDLESCLRDPAAQGDSLESLRTAAFNLKGQGGSVGFAIVSRIGDTLYRLLVARDRLGARDAEIVRAHIEALRAIAVNRCEGEGGEVGREITDALDLLTAKAAK
ncbi:MAG: hypothetical protein K8F57_00335 [Alphaproteobacteria bacterium]|nr:hypothetical protein [Alphaproteobacteria bacterium]